MKRVPNWMKRPCGATFGFGGKLVSFANHKTAGQDAMGHPVQREAGVITIAQVGGGGVMLRQGGGGGGVKTIAFRMWR